MARTISDIQTQIQNVLVSNFAAIGVTIDPTTWSATNVLRLLCFVFSFCANVLETIFDTFKSDTDTALANLKPHKLLWYVNKAKAFQYGFPLITDTDEFDNTGYTDEQIAASKIINYAACVRQINNYGRLSLRMKVATNVGDDLGKVGAAPLAALASYFENNAVDAGTVLNIDSQDADMLRLNYTIYFDPLILDSNGNRLDGTQQNVIETAIKTYLKNLPFNGTFVLAYLTSVLEALPGVVIAKVDMAQYKYGNFDWQNIDTFIVPDGGYLRIYNDTDLTTNFIAQAAIK